MKTMQVFAAGERPTQTRTRPLRASGPEDQTSETHDSKDWGNAILTKNIEEKTVQQENVPVDVAKMKPEPPEIDESS